MASMNSPSTLSLTSLGKRKRTDAPGSMTRSPDMWFNDGNVILEVENTQFRVHQSILACHSSVFKDMFGIPQPEGEPLVEGCPVVHLSDKAADWECLLSIMYYTIQRFKNLRRVPGKFLVSVLRLAEKYSFEAMRDYVAEQAKARFVKTLKEWDALYHSAYNSDSGTTHATEANGAESDWYETEDIFSFINFAEEFKITILLPAAYYTALEILPLEDIIKGLPLEDGTLAQLSPSTQLTLVRSMVRLFAAISDHVYVWLTGRDYVPCAQCTTPARCKEERFVNYERFFPYIRHVICHALDPWVPSYADGFCKACTAAAKGAFEKGRQEIWTNLPTYFDLPAWDDLNDFGH